MTNDNPTGNGGGNGGIVKSVAGVASKTVGALAGTPMLLVLTLLNVAMFGMLTYLIIKSAEYRFAERQEILKILTHCLEQNEKTGGIHYEVPGWNNENTQKVSQ